MYYPQLTGRPLTTEHFTPSFGDVTPGNLIGKDLRKRNYRI